MASYLPHELYDYLSEPAFDVEHNVLYYLRDLVSSGYYRALRLTRGRHIVCQVRDQAKMVADIYCAMNPFDHKAAREVRLRVHILNNQLPLVLCECIRRFHVAAFRCVAGSFYNIASHSFIMVLRELGFHPGYIEALVVDPALLVDYELIGYATPKTYDKVASRFENPALIARNAIIAGNYSLAYHIRAASKGNFVNDLIEAAKSIHPFTGNMFFDTRDQDVLSWMRQEGWITSERLAYTLAHPNEDPAKYRSD